MIKVGINGFGRIGRAIFRVNLLKKYFDIVAINDINPNIDNIAYQLNYDTLYGPLDDKYKSINGTISNSTHSIKILNEKYIQDVPWKENGVDFVIDASGVYENVLEAAQVIEKGVKKVFITHSPDKVDFTMVLGANEHQLDVQGHNIISTSICDATALAPVLKTINNSFGIKTGYVTTLHPWLNYQNVMDGPASSWSVPGTIYHHFALGRSVDGNLIPKPTSAIDATCQALEGVTTDMVGSFSYRTPTAIVGSADITLFIEKDTSKQELIDIFFQNAQYIADQGFAIEQSQVFYFYPVTSQPCRYNDGNITVHHFLQTIVFEHVPLDQRPCWHNPIHYHTTRLTLSIDHF